MLKAVYINVFDLPEIVYILILVRKDYKTIIFYFSDAKHQVLLILLGHT